MDDWAVQTKVIGFEDASLGSFKSKTLILDSGTSFSIIPHGDLETIVKGFAAKFDIKFEVTLAGGWFTYTAQIGSSLYKKLPDLEIEILKSPSDQSGQKFTLSKSEYLYQRNVGYYELTLQSQQNPFLGDKWLLGM